MWVLSRVTVEEHVLSIDGRAAVVRKKSDEPDWWWGVRALDAHSYLHFAKHGRAASEREAKEQALHALSEKANWTAHQLAAQIRTMIADLATRS